MTNVLHIYNTMLQTTYFQILESSYSECSLCISSTWVVCVYLKSISYKTNTNKDYFDCFEAKRILSNAEMRKN